MAIDTLENPGECTGTPTPEINQTQGWNWHPDLPIGVSTAFDVPPTPRKLAHWFRANWLNVSMRVLLLLLSVITWFFWQPALERSINLEWGWIAQMFARNLTLMIVITGGVHLYFWRYKKQGEHLKFDRREQSRNAKIFTFNNQVYDNMFWSLASGVTIWTAFEVLTVWLMANGYVSVLSFNEYPVWFVLWFLAIPMWASFHFWVIHRALHWPPLYRTVHALHHRNTNIGPWAGISMHPVEHVFYYSSVVLHWVIASHPIHILYNLQYQTFTAISGHCGFEHLVVKDKKRLRMGNFYHQLHHRYYECNYGNGEVPMDVWVGTFHDGTPEGKKRSMAHRHQPPVATAK